MLRTEEGLAVLRNSRGKTVARRAMISAIALLVPALAGCEAGLNAPTLTFHAASNGAHTVINDISVNNVFVLGPSSGSTLPVGGAAGLFLALYNNSPRSDSLVKVSAPGTATSVKLEKGTVDLTPGSSALLTGPEPVVVLTGLTRPLTAGQTITITLDFSQTGAVTLQVPVEPHDFYYGTFSPAPTSASPSASPSPSATATK
jgi:copper(I)-binding protein